MNRGSYKRYLEEEENIPKSTRLRWLLEEQRGDYDSSSEQSNSESESAEVSEHVLETDDDGRQDQGPILDYGEHTDAQSEEELLTISDTPSNPAGDTDDSDGVIAPEFNYRTFTAVLEDAEDADAARQAHEEFPSSDIEEQDAFNRQERPAHPQDDSDDDRGAPAEEHDAHHAAGFAEQRQRINIPNGDRPISSEDSDLTRIDSLLAVLSYAVKHHISGVAMEDLISLINLHCPNSLPPSKYLFGSALSDYKGICEFHMYCSSCKKYLGKSHDLPDNCQGCGEEVNRDKSMKDGTFFMVLPLQHHLRHLLESTIVGDKIVNRTVRIRPDCLSDITDGEMYQKLVRDGLLSNTDNFSMLWNTDGVPIFKSSKSSVWPLLCMLNELPLKMRKDNVLLTALWFGDEKPNMNVFLKPFVDECNELASNGMKWNYNGTEKTSRVYSLLCSVDSVARPLLQNMVQFNGFYGCCFCKQKGEYTDGAMKYPYVANPSVKRTERETKEESVMAEESGRSIEGVKGVSVLSFLLYFNIIESFIPDYMHAVCLGVVKRLVTGWFNPTNRFKEFYLGRMKAEINERIASVKCTKEVTRLPRSISEMRFWKANEWRAFLYYSPFILKDILPVKYLAHWSMLVFSVFMLNSSKISLRSLQVSDFLLRKFVLYMEPLYGKQEATFNVHLLLHLADCVRNWGPLWGTSAFSFESYNGYLKKLFAGTRYLPQQIFQSLCRLQDLEANLHLLSSRTVSDYVQRMLSRQVPLKNVHRFPTNFEEVICLGSPLSLRLTQVFKLAINEYLGEDIVVDTVECFERFIFRNVFFSTKTYSEKFRRCNSVIDTDVILGEILHIISFKNHNCLNEDCGCLQNCILLVEKLEVASTLKHHYPQDPELGCDLDFIRKVIRGEIVVLNCNSISVKAMLARLGDEEYVINLPNLFEGD